MADKSTISSVPLREGPGVSAAGGKKSPNPYLQVALTYFRRPFSSPQAGAVSGLFLILSIGHFSILLSGDRPDMAAGSIPMPVVLVMFLFLMFALHVKNQFADSRARLTPGFRRVHATVAAAVAVLLTIVLPMVLIWLADLHSVGLVALAVFLFGAILCSVALHSTLWSWLVVLGFLMMFTEPGRMLCWQLLSGQFEVAAFAILALGAAAALRGGSGLVDLNEDMPVYHLPMCAGWAGSCQTGGQSQAGAGMLPPTLPEWFMENDMARWTKHARCASASSWSSVRRWQVCMSMPDFLMVLFAFVFLSSLTSEQNLLNVGAVVAITMLSFLPSCMAWGSFLRLRAPMLARGLLLPVDRRTFVRQGGTAAAFHQLQAWAGIGALITLWVWLAGPKASSVTDLAVLLAVFTLFQFWFFGLGAWFARYRSFAMLWGGYMLGFQMLIAAGGIGAATDPLIPWKYMGLLLAGAIAIFGLLLTFDAYRRWLVADFD